MSDELFRASVSTGVSIFYPPSLPVPMITGLVVSAVHELAKLGYGVTTAVVEVKSAAQVRISFYRQTAEIICEDIIPVTALWTAYQWGVGMIENMNLDPEDEEEAFADLVKSIQKRRKFM